MARHESNATTTPAPTLVAFAGAAFVVLLFVYLSFGDPAQTSEGVLSGAAPRSSGEQPADVDRFDGRAVPAASAPVLGAERAEVGFDDFRIGAFDAPEWEHSTTSVVVAAHPTPFDRSLAVTSQDGALAQTCYVVRSQVAIVSAHVDISLNGAPASEASVVLRDDGADQLLKVAVSGAQASVTEASGNIAASAEGVHHEAWYGIRLFESASEIAVEIIEQGQSASPIFAASTQGPLRVASICLGISGGSNATAYFDNLRLEYERSSP